MSLIRYQFPQALDRFASFRDDFNRLFDLAVRPSRPVNDWSPALDVYDDHDGYHVSVELPGFKKEDVSISLHDGVLTLSGERKDEREQKDGETFRSERYFGKFQRSVSLPSAVDATKVKATYKDGILTVDLPKAEEAKRKQIEISVN